MIAAASAQKTRNDMSTLAEKVQRDLLLAIENEIGRAHV